MFLLSKIWKGESSSEMPRLEYEELEDTFPDGAIDTVFGEIYVADCISDQGPGITESDMNDPPWGGSSHMAEGISSWIEWEREFDTLS